MGHLKKRNALCLLAGVVAVRAVPEPVVTPPALLPRADYTTLGWYSDGTTDGQTIYSAWEYDIDATTYSTSGQWFRRCPVTATCTMYTGCSDGYLVAESTSSYCGAGGASGSLFCSNHVLYTSMGASQAFSWYWCDEAPLTGYTFFAEEPAQPSFLSSPASSDASTTASDTSATSSSSLQTASATGSAPAESQTTTPNGQDSDGKKTNVGAIAGGVVGGVAVLGIIGVAALFLLRRNKKKKAGGTTSQPPMGYQPPPGAGPQSPYQQSGYPSPNTGYAAAYQGNEAKPQGVQEAGGYYYPNQQPAPYPQGPYDPHVSQYAPAPTTSSPPQQVNAQPHYATPQSYPQELPVTQK